MCAWTSCTSCSTAWATRSIAPVHCSRNMSPPAGLGESPAAASSTTPDIIAANLGCEIQVKGKSDAQACVSGGDVPRNRRLFEEVHGCGGPGDSSRQPSHHG